MQRAQVGLGSESRGGNELQQGNTKPTTHITVPFWVYDAQKVLQTVI